MNKVLEEGVVNLEVISSLGRDGQGPAREDKHKQKKHCVEEE